MKQRLIELMGDMAPATPPLVAMDDKKLDLDSVRHVVLHTELDLPVPVAVHRPTHERKQGTIVIYFTMEGCGPLTGLNGDEMVQKLVGAGFTVAIPQVRGTGVTLQWKTWRRGTLRHGSR